MIIGEEALALSPRFLLYLREDFGKLATIATIANIANIADLAIGAMRGADAMNRVPLRESRPERVGVFLLLKLNFFVSL